MRYYSNRNLRILTWHIHGSYLYYLVQSPHEFFLPVIPGRPQGYSGRSGSFPWPDNVHEVPAEKVKDLEFDCILFQSRKNYFEDQYEILSGEQLTLPKIYLEHDPPREHPTDTCHPVDDPKILLVHVTYFNDLMWDSGSTPTMVIDHGVIIPDDIHYSGEIERGLVIVNNIHIRGRRLGLDIFEEVRKHVPLDLAGMQSKELGGLGDIPLHDLFRLESRYRFIFNPIRYTSLGLSICEAMTIGMPIVGLATTEMVTAIENGISGYVDTDIKKLIDHMQRLLSNPEEATRLGNRARLQAQKRFGIERFTSDWDRAFSTAIKLTAMPVFTGLTEETGYEEKHSDHQ